MTIDIEKATLVVGIIGVVVAVIVAPKQDSPRRAAGWIAAAVGAGLALYFGVQSSVSHGTATNHSDGPGASLPRSSTQQPSVSTQPQPPPASAQLAVSQHSIMPGPRGQLQVKVKMSLKNTGKIPINASIRYIRLLIPDPVTNEHWSPNNPPLTTVFSVKAPDGNNYDAIPANGNNQAEWFDNRRTFASFWFAGTLDPGKPYDGDLVFYVPIPPGATGIRIAGIALVADDDKSVLGWQDNVESWPVREPNEY
jgi:hypothetical protein